jgi:hypothetical protein
MVADTAAHQPPHSAAATPAAFAPPDPRAQARQLLMDGHQLLSQALDQLRSDGDPAGPANLVGQASDRVGSALHFLRLAQRR